MSFSVAGYIVSLSDCPIGSPIHYDQVMDSTNSVAKHLPDEERQHGLVVLADHQTAGRGQYQRTWLSAPAQNLTFSVVLRPARSNGISMMKQVAALAVVDTLTSIGLSDAAIKWPNDVMIGNRKVAGILVEAVFKGSVLDRVIIGIGLNVHQTEFAEDVRYIATSVAQHLSHPPTRETLLANLMRNLHQRYSQWEKHDHALKESIQKHIIGIGSWCHIRINNIPQPEPVKPVGVDDEGHLIVINDQLRPIQFTHEDVRIDRPAEPL